jgi:hypothetical protein
VTAGLARVVLFVVFAPGLAACEVVIGGADHATVRSQDAAAESAPSADGSSAPDVALPDVAMPDVAMPDVHPAMPPPVPCMAPPACIPAAHACTAECMQQYNICSSEHGNPHESSCETTLGDCNGTCQSECITCVDCEPAASACAAP